MFEVLEDVTEEREEITQHKGDDDVNHHLTKVNIRTNNDNINGMMINKRIAVQEKTHINGNESDDREKTQKEMKLWKLTQKKMRRIRRKTSI